MVLLIVCRMSSVLSFLTVASTSSAYLSHVLMSSLFVTALYFPDLASLSQQGNWKVATPYRSAGDLSVVIVLKAEFS